MRFVRLMFRPLQRYADFEGQSSLAEFWAFSLLTVILSIPIAIGDLLARSMSPIHEPVSLAATILLWFPNCALVARRLHSLNMSGLWMFTAIGFIFLALLTNSMVGEAAWGRYVTSFWTVATVLNLLMVLTAVAFLPARAARR